MVTRFSTFSVQTREVMTRISFGPYVKKLGQIHEEQSKCNHFRNKDPFAGQEMPLKQILVLNKNVKKLKCDLAGGETPR